MNTTDNSKNNQNNDWSKKSAKGLSKIQGKWTNPVKISQPWSTGEQRRSGDAQGGADIRFTQESEIQRLQTMLSKSQASERKKTQEVDSSKRRIRELESMLNKNIRHQAV